MPNNLVSYIANYNSQNKKYMIRMSINADFNSIKVVLAKRVDNLKVASWYKRLNKVNNYENYQQVVIDNLDSKLNKLE